MRNSCRPVGYVRDGRQLFSLKALRRWQRFVHESMNLDAGSLEGPDVRQPASFLGLSHSIA